MTVPATLSAVRPLRMAIATELEAITLIQSPAGPKVYRESELPRESPGIPLPYLVMGAVTEIAAGTYGQKGREQTMQIKSWALDSDLADQLDAAVVTKLDDQIIVLSDHVMVRCHIERLTDLADPSGDAHQVISRLQTETLQQ